MDYIKQYKSFIYSNYLSDALRISIGGLLPAVVLSYFGYLQIGVVVSLGAISVSAADSPGPIHHRRNGMLIGCLSIFLVSLITASVSGSTILLGITVAVSCFVFSMIAVYGARASSIGITTLVVMVLSAGQSYKGWGILMHAVFITAGAAWYTILSLAIYSFRPYRLIQQTLGECIMLTANYLRTRSQFYEKNADQEMIYRKLMQQQVEVHHMQDLLRELLFKTRNLVKDSTTTGRTLVMIFVDTVDLFEKATTSFYNYETLHKYFDETNILDRFQEMIIRIADELDRIGIAVKSGRRLSEPTALQEAMKELQDYYNDFRDKHRNPGTIEGLIGLRKILQAMEDMISRIQTLYHYTRFDKKSLAAEVDSEDYLQFVNTQDFSFRVLLDNLGMRSSTFRHALRVSLATVAGYVISTFMHGHHGYWIMLTIIVILKPAYSLSKKRNLERLAGTVGGALAGILILYFIQDKTLLFVFMLVFMIGSYSFLRTNYFISVILMTPYVLLIFHFLGGESFKTIFSERVLDTAIGSAIAFVASFLSPSWEQEQIKMYMAAALQDSLQYFKDVAENISGKQLQDLDNKLSRKNAFVSLANLSEAFSRMLSEPRSRQTDAKSIHQFVVMNHMLTSHIASLSHFAKQFGAKYRQVDFSKIISQTIHELTGARQLLENSLAAIVIPASEENFTENKEVSALLEKRKNELARGEFNTETRIHLSELKPVADQFRFIAGIARDLRITCSQLKA
jgi:uncharacterized membrane protein (TIGR01666 family)